jgi:hypothetical protein
MRRGQKETHAIGIEAYAALQYTAPPRPRVPFAAPPGTAGDFQLGV